MRLCPSVLLIFVVFAVGCATTTTNQPTTTVVSSAPVDVPFGRLASMGDDYAGQAIRTSGAFGAVAMDMLNDCGDGYIQTTWYATDANGQMTGSTSLWYVCVPDRLADPLFTATPGDVFEVTGTVIEARGRTAIASELTGVRINVSALRFVSAHVTPTINVQ